jgi:CMP-N-acetylneuraminic acid synthetase
MSKTTAIIVAKENSERLPNKNMLDFGNSTILGHKINQLKKCKKVNEVIVGSDSEEILKYSKELGAVPIKRSKKYCNESISSANDMIGNMMSLMKNKDIILWAHCTNPNIQPSTYDLAIETYEKIIKKETRPKALEYYDSLMSVDKVQEHLWLKCYGDYARPDNHRPWNLPHALAKDLPETWKQNGAIFIQSYKNMKENSYFYGERPWIMETPVEESHDINTELDYYIAESIHKKYFKNYT